MSLLAVSISVNSILYAVLIVGGVGLFIGIALGIAGKFLSVEVDEKEVAIREELPGNNCGGCGYPGCDGLAAAIAAGKSTGKWLSGRRQRSGKSHCSYHGRRDKKKDAA